MTQLVLDIERPAVMPILKKLISVIEGVSIARPARRTKALRHTATDEWLDEETRQAIARGKADIANGRAKQMTASEIRSMLGA